MIAIAEPIIDGKGGGKKTLAQSGGKNIDALDDALDAIVENITRRVMKILGIESSCDETAIAVLDDSKKIYCDEVFSQISLASTLWRCGA